MSIKRLLTLIHFPCEHFYFWRFLNFAGRIFWKKKTNKYVLLRYDKIHEYEFAIIQHNILKIEIFSQLRQIRTFAASGQISLSLQQERLYKLMHFTSTQPARTPRYPDGFNRSLQCPDWPE